MITGQILDLLRRESQQDFLKDWMWDIKKIWVKNDCKIFVLSKGRI